MGGRSGDNLSHGDVAVGMIVLAIELSWNGLLAHLGTDGTVSAIVSTLSPVVNTAVIVFALCYVSHRVLVSRIRAQCRGESEALRARLAELEARLRAYDDADSRVQAAVDVDDYMRLNGPSQRGNG